MSKLRSWRKEDPSDGMPYDVVEEGRKNIEVDTKQALSWTG